MCHRWSPMCGRRHRARGAGAGPVPVTCASSRIALQGVRTGVTRDLISFPIRCCLILGLGQSGILTVDVFVLLTWAFGLVDMTDPPSIPCLLDLILPLPRILTPALLTTYKSAIPPRHPSHITPHSCSILISLSHICIIFSTIRPLTTRQQLSFIRTIVKMYHLQFLCLVRRPKMKFHFT
jgi:hypothetical protein